MTLEFGERSAKTMSIDEAAMIAFMEKGWRLPTLAEYLEYSEEELKACWDDSDINNPAQRFNVAYLRLVRDIC